MAHNNHQLFSDYYLNTLLPGNADWRALAGPAQVVKARLQALFDAYAPSDKEAQLEREVIIPALEALEHTFEVQAALKTPDGTKKPDYVFYADLAAQNAQKKKTLTDALPQQGGLAVGDAKYWDRPLDMALTAKSSDPFSNKNPSYQIAFYIQHSGVEWGILTNGRLWRLYHKDTAHKLDRFYEVDLPALLRSEDEADFLYFFGFFHRTAFDAHPLGVSALLRASQEYARGVGDSLKRQVYEALRHLSQGFLDYAPNGLATDAGTLKDIYDSALILLYRLLFILYAESRELLPVRESALYRESYGLHAIKQEVAEALGLGKHLLPGSATLWPRLKTLFGYIDKGEPPLQVATFNGGLFDPGRHPFLERFTVGDAHLQQAIDGLARVNGQFVDYRDLSVRHLGTIYEGLLEYHLEVGEEAEEGPHPVSEGPHPARLGSPPSPKSGRGLGEGDGGRTVALLNDKGERKATGSYYTPDYIVKYIVEQAVGPMLREAVAGMTEDGAKVEAVLGVNMLDPAMGSGHFLVEATEFIAGFLVEAAVTPGPDAGGEADLLYWKRRVAQSCIYGVDLNPLAVELAKLSLWLTTVAKGRPLSFLDHHLRTGNALVGARLSDLQLGGKPKKTKQAAGAVARRESEGQLSMMADDTFRQSMSLAVGSMWAIEERDAQTVEDVKMQEKVYTSLRETFTRKWGRLADLVTATHFGVAIDHFLWKPLAAYAKGEAVSTLPKFAEWLAASDALAKERHFFHWELEFPEVFFDRFGKPLDDKAGFDAVVGNPPYIRQEELSAFKPYFAADFPEVYHGVADIFVYFFGQGLRQLQRGGRLSYISSGTFRKLNFGAPLRQHLSSASTLVEIVEFGEQQVFSDAITYPVILCLEKEPPGANATVMLKTGNDLTERSATGMASPAPTGSGAWVFSSKQLAHVLHGWKDSTPLGEVLNKPIYRGVTTGLNKAFVIDTATRDALILADANSVELIKPFVRGEDLQPWYHKETEHWLIALPSGFTLTKYGLKHDEQAAWDKVNSDYPAIATYLLPFADAGRSRLDKGQYWWELRPCNYYSAFERPRIHSTKISLYPTFSLSEETAYAGNTSYVLPLSDAADGYYLLGLLNSHVSEYFCRQVFATKANGYYEVQPGELSKFPVPNATDADKEAIGGLAMTLIEHARARYALHCQVRRRIQQDLGRPDPPLNQKLTAWWTLTFAALRAELKKVYKNDIAVKDRDEWQAWFDAQQADHRRLTAEIVAGEESLNKRVYALFELTAEEIKVVEAQTKYRYGEV